MILYGSTRSPFVRKVIAVGIAAGVDDRIGVTAADPWGDDAFAAKNPLSKIPALETDDGTLLFDSPVICAYLNHLGGGSLVPEAGPALWRSMRQEAIADGVCDAAVLRRLELSRPDGERSDAWAARQARAMSLGCAALESETDAMADMTIGSIAVAVMLSYLDFRWPDEPWRTGKPALARWFEKQEKLPMMARTAFADSA